MLLENTLILSLQHFLRLLLPLLVIPLVATTVSSEEFGIYMYMVSAATWLSMLLDYGFNISASRIVARCNDEDDLRKIIVATQSAKTIIIIISAVIAAGLIVFFRILTTYWQWSLSAWALGVLIALHPNYYFQGRERLRLVGWTELFVGAATFLLVLLLVREPEQFFRLPLILVCTRALSLLLLTRRMWHETDLSWLAMFHWKSGLKSLRSHYDVFTFQASVSLYTSFNVIFLGLLVSPEHVGTYATAEKVMRAGVGFIGQFSTALFARLNSLYKTNPPVMALTRRKALFGMTAVGLAGCVIAIVIGPFAANWLLGGKGTEAESIIQIMAIAVPAIALSNTLGFQYLLISQQERAFNRVIIAAAMISLPLSYFLTSLMGAKGMALSWVVIEWVISLALIGLVKNFIKTSKII